MKRIIICALLLLFVLTMQAQTNDIPVRLALFAESVEAAGASDTLTAQLSQNQKVQMLERNEIAKVYREQGLSAQNKDYQKLGQILGADGLLLLNVVRTPKATNLTARMIAVKPGVVLTDGTFPWPLESTTQWAESISTYLNGFLPKLRVLVNDAIPISVVNLRSATQSSNSKETEQQLKLLTIQRMSQQPEFFVLERQRMQLLSEEKELKSDTSSFWSGSYLLEGVVDQNGYSQNIITINARLTPSKGGAPLLIEVSGNRNDFTEVINLLAEKITGLLKVQSTVKPWNAADEAGKFFNEAQLALRWGLYLEAQMAADSAWALGKRDVDCAIVRVDSYRSEVVANVRTYKRAGRYYSTYAGYDINGRPFGKGPSEAEIQSDIQKMVAQHPWGIAYTRTEDKAHNTKYVGYIFVNEPLDPQPLKPATRALDIYYEFSRQMPPDEPKVASEWYILGVKLVKDCSRLLENFNFVRPSQNPVKHELAELRALTRFVADWISKSPSVHKVFWLGHEPQMSETHVTVGQSTTSRKIEYTLDGQPFPKHLFQNWASNRVESIYTYKLDWGCFWHDNPEDSIAMYREIMGSPNFGSFHRNFLAPRSETLVRVAAWSEEDLKRAPIVWENFVQELCASSNLVMQAEGKALRFGNEDKDAILSQIAASEKQSQHFEKQKEFLRNHTPYDNGQFNQVFCATDYTKEQAAVMLPLLLAYQSNLIVHAQHKSKADQFTATHNSNWIEMSVVKPVKDILNPPLIQPLTELAKKTVPVPSPTPKMVAKIPEDQDSTNVIAVNKFFEIPLNGLEGDEASCVEIVAHHWIEGKLLLDFQYSTFLSSFDANGSWKSTRNPTLSAIAILDPVKERWQVISCPETPTLDNSKNKHYHRSTLFNDKLYTCDGNQIRTFDFVARSWKNLEIAEQGNYQLFAVNGHLYAANENAIFEIVDGGRGTVLLASRRRQPPVSVLDTQDLGIPTLFSGPDCNLFISLKNTILTQAGNGWREVCSAPPTTFHLEIFEEGVLFRDADRLSRFSTVSNVVDLCLARKPPQSIHANPSVSMVDTKPIWKLPKGLALPNLASAIWKSDMYLLVDHSEAQNIINEQQVRIGRKMLSKNGHHTALLRFSSDPPLMQTVYLKFDGPVCPPVTGIDPTTQTPFATMPPAWMLFTTNFLFCGLEYPIRNGGGQSNFYKPGIWLMPLDQIKTAVSAQRQFQLAEIVRKTTMQKQAQKELIAKHDRNHSGAIEVGEREDSLDDPFFIESALNAIDANRNGHLDPEELTYFDANQNKMLESKELAGIDLAQKALAAKLMTRFDYSDDGLLDNAETEEFIKSGMGITNRHTLYITLREEKVDGKVELAELESFQNKEMRNKLRVFRTPEPDFSARSRKVSQPLKTDVESYWQNSRRRTNTPPFNPGRR